MPDWNSVETGTNNFFGTINSFMGISYLDFFKIAYFKPKDVLLNVPGINVRTPEEKMYF